MSTSFSSVTLAHLHASFLTLVLPRVLSHGRVSLRSIKCPHHREDAIQEMIGLAWQWHVRLAERGKDATCFPTALASYAARAVKSGCRVCGQERANDVLSPVAQQRHRFAVATLPDYEYVTFDEFHLVIRVPADLEDSACEVIRRILETRPFQTDLRRAVRQVVRRYPDLAPVRVRISV